MKQIKRKKTFSKRLVLRPLSSNDHQTWFDYYVNRSKKRSKYDRPPMKAEKCAPKDFKKIRDRHSRLAKQDRVYIYGGFDKRTGRLVGLIDIAVIARDCYQMGNLGYQVHNTLWGKGYGKELALIGAKIAFSQLNLNRVEAAINLDNKRSIALAKAIKMRSEGIRKRYLYEDKKWTDNYVFSLNPEDIGLKGKPPK